MANPINASFCIGPGLGVDSFGRPTWTRTLAGQWSSASVARNGIQGTGLVVVSNLVAQIQNTASHARELVARAQSIYVDILNYTDAAPQILWQFGVGVGITAGFSDIGHGYVDGLAFRYRVRFPGVTGGPIFTTVAAGSSINVAITLLARCGHDVGIIDVFDPGLFIEAHWLGG